MAKALVILGLLLCLLPAAFSAAGPHISFDAVEHDFGDVIYGDSTSAEMNLTNTGDAVLILGRIDSSCGCTKGVPESKEVAPGASNRIFTKIDTDGLSPGPHAKSIEVHSNDPDRPVTVIMLKFNVVRNISIEPCNLGLSLSEWGNDAVFTLTASNTGTEPVTLKGAKANGSDEVKLLSEEVIVPPGRRVNFQLAVKIHPRGGQAFAKGSAQIETTDKREKTIPIRYLIKLPQIGGR